MSFPDYLFPEKGRSYLHHEEVLQYLENYADHFNLKKFIKVGIILFKYNTTVLMVLEEWRVYYWMKFFENNYLIISVFNKKVENNDMTYYYYYLYLFICLLVSFKIVIIFLIILWIDVWPVTTLRRPQMLMHVYII